MGRFKSGLLCGIVLIENLCLGYFFSVTEVWSKTMELNLFDNALNSISHGLEHYSRGIEDDTNYKFAILHIAQGTELLLKERLSREHPVLIFEKVEKPQGKTIDFDCSVARLQNICHISLDKRIRELRTMQYVRNEIEHYKFIITKNEAETLIGSIVPFLLEFLENELDTKLQDAVSDDVWQELLLISEVYNKAKKDADEQIEALKYEEREGDYHPVWTCAQCREEYMVEDKDVEGEAICLLCGHVSQLVDCRKCGSHFPEDDEDAEHGLCSTCADYIKQPYT